MSGRKLFRTVAFPLFLMLACPIAVIVVWWTNLAYSGSLTAMVHDFSVDKFLHAWPWPTFAAAKILAVFAAVELALLLALPGRELLGPLTPKGNRNTYKLNGPLAWAVTHVLWYLGAYQMKWFSPSIVYDHFGPIIITLSVFSLLLCTVLYFKGIYFPSSSDSGRVENPIFDFFWGTELHPRFGNFDLKQFINCRVAMMGWSIIILSFLGRQQLTEGHVSNSMLISVGLQVLYIAKFFWSEHWYFATLDIMHDRFGWYICWGITVWLPVVYTGHTLYLVKHPYDLSPVVAGTIVAIGVLAFYMNFDADAQRQRVRRTAGKCTVWGKQPNVIIAKYGTADGQEKESLLLASGWWGVARHFHYVGEILLALAWTVPCLFENALPYFYPAFLTILLFHRALRDDKRCSDKYGAYWAQYCERVPYKIVPGIF